MLGKRVGGEGATEDEMIRQHHRLNGHESEQTQEDSGGQSLARWPWDCKESDTTQQLKNNNNDNKNKQQQK